MILPQQGSLLRIFIGESDRFEHKPLYEAIVLKARELHLAGATVVRGSMGFGKSSRLHTSKILRLSMDLPVIIEIVDSEENIQRFLPSLSEMIKGGLVIVEQVRVIDYRGEAPS
jgi:uncharacterized protein